MLFVAPVNQALASALPLGFALLLGSPEIAPDKINDQTDREAGNPGGGNITKPDLTESCHD